MLHLHHGRIRCGQGWWTGLTPGGLMQSAGRSPPRDPAQTAREIDSALMLSFSGTMVRVTIANAAGPFSDSSR